MLNWIDSDTLEPFNFLDMLNWTVWNRTVFILNCQQKLYLNKQVSVKKYVIKWIAWNRTIFTFNCVFSLDRNKWKHLIARKNEFRLILKFYLLNTFRNHISNTYSMYKTDLAFNDLQFLICYKTKPNQKKKPQSFMFNIYLWKVFGM